MSELELPEGWVYKYLGSLASFIMGQAPPGELCNKDGVGTPFVKAGEFGTLKPIIREWTTKPLKLAREGDILICVVGATNGKLNYGADCAIGRSVAAVRPSASLDQKYLFGFMSTLVLQLRTGSVGSAQGVISREVLANLKVPLPSVPEQRQIVAKIDRLSARSKRARSELQTLQPLIDRLKKSLLAKEFSASSDAYKPLASFVKDSLIGLVRSKEDQSSSGVAYIRMQHFDLSGAWDFSGVTFVDATQKEILRYTLNKNDILFNTRNSIELVGKVAFWPDLQAKHVYNNNLLRLRFTTEMDARFAYLQMRSPSFRFALAGLKSATTSVAAIYQKPLLNLPFWCPPLAEQHEIVRRIEHAFAAIDRLAAEAQSARALLDTLDQAILAKAFRGELVPQNPNDEPASVLLERIRAERAAAPPKPRRRGKA